MSGAVKDREVNFTVIWYFLEDREVLFFRKSAVLPRYKEIERYLAPLQIFKGLTFVI